MFDTNCNQFPSIFYLSLPVWVLSLVHRLAALQAGPFDTDKQTTRTVEHSNANKQMQNNFCVRHNSTLAPNKKKSNERIATKPRLLIKIRLHAILTRSVRSLFSLILARLLVVHRVFMSWLSSIVMLQFNPFMIFWRQDVTLRRFFFLMWVWVHPFEQETTLQAFGCFCSIHC